MPTTWVGPLSEQAQVHPFLDWLRASTQRLGPAASDRNKSVMDLDLEHTAPVPCVITWMKNRLSRFRSPCPLPAPIPARGGVVNPAPLGVLVPNREFSQQEIETIQAAYGINYADWAKECPELYSRMLEEGRKGPKIRALLTDLLRPTDMESLTNMHVPVTDDMAKDVKELTSRTQRVTVDCHRLR
jgi:hypothetical protein